MGEIIGDMDIELEQKDKKIQFLENKMGIADDQIVEERNRLDLNKLYNKGKKDRIMYRLNKTHNNHKYVTN